MLFLVLINLQIGFLLSLLSYHKNIFVEGLLDDELNQLNEMIVAIRRNPLYE
jgi:hypothetical protein